VRVVDDVEAVIQINEVVTEYLRVDERREEDERERDERRHGHRRFGPRLDRRCPKRLLLASWRHRSTGRLQAYLPR
jgi:hypothetical protein